MSTPALDAVLRAPDLVLRYHAGHRAAPDDPFGEVLLEVAADGRVRLERWKGARHDHWRGRTEPAVVAAVLADLGRSPFPALPLAALPPPGAGPVELAVRAGGAELVARTFTSAVGRIEGLREAVAALDRLVRAASDGAIRSGWGEPPPFVAEPA